MSGRACSICRKSGHNKRTCPNKPVKKIISWNINGIRTNIVDSTIPSKKNTKIRTLEPTSALGIITNTFDPDIICFQETRLDTNLYHLFEGSIRDIYPYQYWSSSAKSGHRGGNRYSGTSIWSKEPAIAELYDVPGLNNDEGRFIQLEFPTFILITTYTPNTGTNWTYRLETWEPCIRAHIQNIQAQTTKPLIYCGDMNVAIKRGVWFGDLLEHELDAELLRPVQNKVVIKKLTTKVRSKRRFHDGTSKKKLNGYTSEERETYSQLLNDCQLVDTFRSMYPDTYDKFTWFDIRTRDSLIKNRGWLIDRFLVNREIQSQVRNVEILYEIGTHNERGFISDHLPVMLSIQL